MQPKDFYEFGRFHLDLGERHLLRDSEVVSLTPKEFELLLVLIRHSGKLVTYDELKEAVWPELVHVEDKTLTQTIYTLRGSLGDSSKEQRYIENVPKRGYRFVAEVKEHRNEEERNVQNNAEPISEELPPTSNGNKRFKPLFLSPRVLSVGALLLCIVIGMTIVRRGIETPKETQVTPSGEKVEVEVWWPENGARVSGTQPFKAMVTNRSLPQYTLYWQVDEGRLSPLADNYEDYPHKEVSVDLGDWTWRGNGPYKVNFVAKDLGGNTIAQQAVDIYVE